MRKATVVLVAAGIGLWITGSMAKAQTSAVRDGKESGISFRLASERPARGFEVMNIGRDERLYVANDAVLAGDDVTASEAVEVRSGADVKLSLKAGALDRVRTQMRATGADRMAVLSGGKIVASGTLTIDGERLSLTGMSSTQATRVTRVLSRDGAPIPSGAVVTLVPSQNHVAPGGSLNVDVFVNNATDLRSYQITLAINGGTSGGLTVSNLQIDNSRDSYIFGTQQKFDAVDEIGGRLGGVLFSGSINVANPAYVGTFTLSATNDAAGAFNVKVEQAGHASMLYSDQNNVIEFTTPTINISVGSKPAGIRSRD